MAGMTQSEEIKMHTCLDLLRQIVNTASRSRTKVDFVYREEDEESVKMYSDFQREYHRIYPGNWYVYVYDVEDASILYAINVTLDSVMTAIGEVMAKIAPKF